VNYIPAIAIIGQTTIRAELETTYKNVNMRKLLLTFILFSIVLLARAVTATIYVKAESAPYLYSWYNGVSGFFRLVKLG